MNIILEKVAAGLAALAMTGCSSGPEIAVTSSGAIPASGTYAIVESAPGDVGRAVSEVLARRGLTQSESPRYIVQVGYAERPAGTGLLVPQDVDRAWLRQPNPYSRKRLVQTLGISIADAMDGREVYRAEASGRTRTKTGVGAPLLQVIFPLAAPGAD